MDLDKVNCPVCSHSTVRNKEYPNSTLFYCSRCKKYYSVIEVTMQERPELSKFKRHKIKTKTKI